MRLKKFESFFKYKFNVLIRENLTRIESFNKNYLSSRKDVESVMTNQELSVAA